MLSSFTATATTCAISPGSEEMDENGRLRIRDRMFTDTVQSADSRIAGTNRPSLDIDVDTRTGSATLRGSFTLLPDNAQGSWRGELSGTISDGMVMARGVARGGGDLEGAVLTVDFRQVPALVTPAPCEAPMAYFEMEGMILDLG